MPNEQMLPLEYLNHARVLVQDFEGGNRTAAFPEPAEPEMAKEGFAPHVPDQIDWVAEHVGTEPMLITAELYDAEELKDELTPTVEAETKDRIETNEQKSATEIRRLQEELFRPYRYRWGQA